MLSKKKDWLSHHGIKGQKWGKRNGPPYPLDKSSHSKEEQSANWKTSVSIHRIKAAAKTMKAVDSIINSMNADDKNKVLAGSDHYLSLEEGEYVMKRFVKNYGKIPVSFFDIMEEDETSLNVALGTRSGDKYRGKGYGSEVAEQAIKWIEKNKKRLTQSQIVWGVRTDNVGSIRIAEKNGFVLDEDSYSDDGEWVNYIKKLK